MRIDSLAARSILDTRGKPTIEVTLTAGTVSATASVPSGKSTGSGEAYELRDPDGSVTNEVLDENSELAKAIVGREFASLDELDAFLIALDGTTNKSRLGANEILSVSLAAMRLSALIDGIPLWKAIAKRAGTTPSAPRLFVNVMNGGVHADFRLPFQEYILVCEGKTSAALATARAAFTELGTKLGDVPMGDEGGYSPTFASIEEPFNLLKNIVAAHSDTSIAIDAAATELFHEGSYKLLDKNYSALELSGLYETLATKYPFHSIEDPFAENASFDFASLTERLSDASTPLGAKKLLVIGDDFTVTNPARIAAAREAKAINAVLIKPNQIGTVKETIEAVQATYAAGWQAVCSHRSGETDDTFIADFAYGVGAHGIKAGGLGQKQRVEKYERLVAIEAEAV